MIFTLYNQIKEKNLWIKLLPIHPKFPIPVYYYRNVGDKICIFTGVYTIPPLLYKPLLLTWLSLLVKGHIIAVSVVRIMMSRIICNNQRYWTADDFWKICRVKQMLVLLTLSTQKNAGQVQSFSEWRKMIWWRGIFLLNMQNE